MSGQKAGKWEAYPRSLWLAVAGSLVGAFQFGYQVGVLNTALPFIGKDLHYHRDDVLSSAVVLGAAGGAITAGRLADQLGPRHAQVANCLAFLIGSLVTALARHKYAFLAGRFIAGIGAGAASLYVPRYIAEISPPALRGWLGSLNQVLINTGILVAYCAGIPYELGFKGFDVMGDLWCSWWRAMTALGILPVVLQVLVMAWCPESPVWLEGIGRRDAADAACLKLWGSHALLPEPDFEADAARAADLVSSASGNWTAATAAAAAAVTQYQPPQPPHGGGGSSSSSGFLAPAGCSPVRRYEPSRVLDTPFRSGSSIGRGAAGSSSWGAGSCSLGHGECAEGLLREQVVPGSSGRSGAGFGGVQGRGRQAAGLSGWDNLLERRYRWMMILALGLPLLQQASGINTVVFYSSQVFKAAGLKSPIAASIITGGVNLLFTIAAAAVMDRHGRKPLLLLSYGGMALSLLTVSGLTLLPLSEAVSGDLMVLLVLVYVAFFAAGSGPVTWVLLSEVLPPGIKGPAASLATAAGWAGNLAVTGSFNSLLQHLGLGGTYLLYAFMNAAAVAYVTGMVVETKCRSLAEIEELLLLPDMDPRLAALLPALQQSGSPISSTSTTAAAAGEADGAAGSSSN